MDLYRVRQQHHHISSRVEAYHCRAATEGFVIEVCTRTCPVSLHNADMCRLAICKHTFRYTHKILLFLPCPIFLSPVHHTFLKHTTPPNTHIHTVLSFLDVSVHDSLAANPSVGWMSVSSPFIIRLIRHPRHCFYISQQSH